MKTLTELAQVLERARQERKLTYDELARATGLTPLATRRALQARTAPRVTTLMALAERLGLEVVLVPRVVAQGLGPAPEAERRPLSTVEKLVAGEPAIAPAGGGKEPR
jgi:transcriptional regulator with XRE-family HTH domain